MAFHHDPESDFQMTLEIKGLKESDVVERVFLPMNWCAYPR